MKAKEMREDMIVEVNGEVGVITKINQKNIVINVSGCNTEIPYSNFRFIQRI